MKLEIIKLLKKEVQDIYTEQQGIYYPHQEMEAVLKVDCVITRVVISFNKQTLANVMFLRDECINFVLTKADYFTKPDEPCIQPTAHKQEYFDLFGQKQKINLNDNSYSVTYEYDDLDTLNKVIDELETEYCAHCGTKLILCAKESNKVTTYYKHPKGAVCLKKTVQVKDKNFLSIEKEEIERKSREGVVCNRFDGKHNKPLSIKEAMKHHRGEYKVVPDNQLKMYGIGFYEMNGDRYYYTIENNTPYWISPQDK